jgi:SAM-dependent methyltransferase
MNQKTNSLRDTIYAYLKWAPLSLVIREITRIHALKAISCQYELHEHMKILDVGCGDGHWWKFFENFKLSNICGVDISQSEVDIAKKFINAKCVDITNDDFNKEFNQEFDLIIGNCSLEHIFNLEAALRNIKRSLSPGGYFILFVPTPTWAMNGESVEIMHRISPRFSMAFSGVLNGFFQHWHLYNHRVWRLILESIGFKYIEAKGLGNKKLEFLFRLFLIPAFISFVFKALTGKYINYYLSVFVPKKFLSIFVNKIDDNLLNSLNSPDDKTVFEYILVCKNE